MTKMCPNLLLGVSGSLHTLHLHEYLRLFRDVFADRIRVVMTSSASRMVSPQVVELYTEDRVYLDLWDHSSDVKCPHIHLTKWADCFIVVPATANTIGKAANGIADDLLSTTILSYPKPVVFAPAMNSAMWASKALQRNLEQLRSDGHYVIPPTEGFSVAGGEGDTSLTPTPNEALLHIQHFRMTALRAEYWEEATSERARTPFEQKQRGLAGADLSLKAEQLLPMA